VGRNDEISKLLGTAFGLSITSGDVDVFFACTNQEIPWLLVFDKNEFYM
jgi:hypothetical protein